MSTKLFCGRYNDLSDIDHIMCCNKNMNFILLTGAVGLGFAWKACELNMQTATVLRLFAASMDFKNNLLFIDHHRQ